MVALNQVVADGAHLVARAVEYQIRQATSTVLSSSNSATPSPTSGTSISSTTSPTASPDPSPTNNSNNDQNNGGQSSTSSPLLFFVALGFGVVFTNLWIIVGVKYCFRYNARNRQLRGLDENGEPINLENMPARPHRRRREKKLMTMDEVNEKFPMMKYKAWVSARAREGLPTAGGVSAPASRANSVMSVEGIVPETPSKEPSHTEEHLDSVAIPKVADHEKPNPSPGIQHNTSENNAATEDTLTQSRTAESIITKDHDHRTSVDEDDEDEHIDAALPPELVGTQGDTCAICIDTLEDDDDIRGLTCGHAFHAVCIDPWLTNRRASCPLCKADYYTPKPRPPPADGDPTSPTSPNADPTRNNGRMNMPMSPQRTFTSWSNFRGGPRGMIPGRFGGVGAGTESSNYSRQPRIWERNRADRQRSHTEAQPAASDNPGLFTRVRSRFPPFRLNDMMRRERNGQANEASEATASGANGAANTTPSQLEAGVRPSATTAN
ncbi:uncharacterized protein GGS22DRAFT_71796 [Annulohypoxylon maeteangense]|uniref:uncharacterized protein n=1 Tax=Annulohypoxylon maeteangense TaxID=1927788 RepID=UPI002008479B|nr:uncharacterized protein GGS22DRAFT_71796 [Annulohypoxylon maeteangense]KAI0881193.1 hypothetical protein GGS22DRAFT_71796 [Annulohypoxylon maeteangense]